MTIRAADAALNSELTGYKFLDKYVNDKLKITAQVCRTGAVIFVSYY